MASEKRTLMGMENANSLRNSSSLNMDDVMKDDADDNDSDVIDEEFN
jgi:hypothetical protein